MFNDIISCLAGEPAAAALFAWEAMLASGAAEPVPGKASYLLDRLESSSLIRIDRHPKRTFLKYGGPCITVHNVIMGIGRQLLAGANPPEWMWRTSGTIDDMVRSN